MTAHIAMAAVFCCQHLRVWWIAVSMLHNDTRLPCLNWQGQGFRLNNESWLEGEVDTMLCFAESAAATVALCAASLLTSPIQLLAQIIQCW